MAGRIYCGLCPRGVPKSSWRGASRAPKWSLTWNAVILVARQRGGAISCTPPSLSSKATKEVQKKVGRMDVWVLASRMRFERDVSSQQGATACLSWESVMSLRCWGLKPSGPSADPFGKECMACKTSSSITEDERIGSWVCGGMQESGCGARCFCWVFGVESLISAQEQVRRTAPPKIAFLQLCGHYGSRGVRRCSVLWVLPLVLGCPARRWVWIVFLGDLPVDGLRHAPALASSLKDAIPRGMIVGCYNSLDNGGQFLCRRVPQGAWNRFDRLYISADNIRICYFAMKYLEIEL